MWLSMLLLTVQVASASVSTDAHQATRRWHQVAAPSKEGSDATPVAEVHSAKELNRWERMSNRIQKNKWIKRWSEITATGSEEKGMNAMAIAGFVCSLVLPPLGIIFSAIALSQLKKSGGQGKGLATAGLVIGIVFTSLFLLF